MEAEWSLVTQQNSAAESVEKSAFPEFPHCKMLIGMCGINFM